VDKDILQSSQLEVTIEMNEEHLDVLIVGAGISGIGAGYYLKNKCPNKSFKIIESRKKLGGTWDLFKYPGIRSDSDMTTMGFRFKPWTGKNLVAGGAAILDYLNDVVDENGFREKIQYDSHVTNASWKSSESKWYVTYRNKNDETKSLITCSFLYFCVGYYNYDRGHEPSFNGQNNFKGTIIHPQHWPENLDYKEKNVVVIGSGATAVTLIPSMADETKHITMLQRSPTYYMVRPNIDPIGAFFRRFMGKTVSYFVMRWKNIQLQSWFFKRARKDPKLIKEFLIGVVKEKLSPDYNVNKHFTPSYNPWEQRLCLVPDGDLFTSINDGKASVVTDQVESFTTDGIKLKSGKELPADIIVTATGLKLQVCGNIEISVDDEIIDISKTMTFKGMMVSDVPNVVWTFGYTNASWTLRADLTAEYTCKIINYMDKNGYSVAIPSPSSEVGEEGSWLDFNSGYVTRSTHLFPRQGNRDPWRNTQNYTKDVFNLRYGKVNDDELEFS